MKLAMPCRALLFGLFAAMAAVAAEPDPLPQRLAIERVTVLPMNSEAAALPDVTVLIEDGRIVSVTPASSTRTERSEAHRRSRQVAHTGLDRYACASR